MFRFLFKSSFQLTRSGNPTLGLSLSSLRCFSTLAHYLVYSHAFPWEDALCVSNLPQPKDPKTFDSVITLLKGYGFTPKIIAGIVSKSSAFISPRAYKTIKPKLEFLSEKGITDGVLVYLVSSNPHLMAHSLNNHIIPALNCLIHFFGLENVKSIFMKKRGGWCLRVFNKEYATNIRTLKEIGVPDYNIIRMINLRPVSLCRESNSFRAAVNKVKQMGSQPSNLMFIHAVSCMLATDSVKWAAKMAAFEKFGWSRGDVEALFVKQPGAMRSRVARIERNLSFFMNELGWSIHDITTYPTVFISSFEKKTLPRSIVFQFLLSKNLVKKSSMGTALLMPEDNFRKKYLLTFKGELPEIVEMYLNPIGHVEVRVGKEQQQEKEL